MTTAAPSPSSELQPLALPAPNVPGADGWKVHVYAHTHWDREWYRTFERFRMQLVGMVDRLLAQLDADPRFAAFVLDGQTIVLEDYLAIRPEEEGRIRRLVGEGRLEIGPWHVLPDEFLVSGESLIRNLAEGRRVASRFGEPLAVGYLPDPFGHVAQLPNVLRGFGVDNVIFSRGMTDEFARTGTEFRWEAPDGTDVLAVVQASHFTNGYCNFELVGRNNTAADDAVYDSALGLAAFLPQHARTDVMLFAAGCDHETVQEELPVIIDRVGELLPGADVRITGLDAMLASIRDAEARLVADGRPLERLTGELRGSLLAPILTSIYSARIALKQDNDRAQSLLERHVEPIMATAVAAGVRPAKDVLPFLRHAWRLVLENHPHDSIGGCSVDLVHEEMPARTLRAEATGLGLVEDLRIALDLMDVAVVHDAEGTGGIAVRADGTPVAVAPSTPGVLVPFDAQVLDAGAEVVDASTVRAGELVVEVVEGAAGAGLHVRRGAHSTLLEWIDEADAGDEYDFSPIPGDELLVATIDRWTTRMAGPGVAELEVVHVLDLPAELTEDRQRRSATTLRHEIVTRVRVSAASELAQLNVTFDNQSKDHRLRLRATAAVDASIESTVEALQHFAVVERPVRPVAPVGTWQQDPPGVDHCLNAVRLLPAGAHEHAVLLAGRGIHEYESRERASTGTYGVEITALRAMSWLSRGDIVGRPIQAGPPIFTPGAQEIGPRELDLAVGVGTGAQFAATRSFLHAPMVLEPFGLDATREGGTWARMRDVRSVTPDGAASAIAAIGLELDGTDVVPSACKLADDGSGDLIVRWWAPATAAAPHARVRLAAQVASAHLARLDETPLDALQVVDGVIDVDLAPGAIATVRIALA